MARDLPSNLQHHNPDLPRRANIFTIQDSDLALDKNARSLPRAIGPRDNSRLLRLPLRPRKIILLLPGKPSSVQLGSEMPEPTESGAR